MQSMVTVCDTNVAMKEYKGKPVVTFKDVDRVHRRPDGTASRNFRANRDRFLVNRDYYSVDGTADEIRRRFDLGKHAGGVLLLLTESGYLMLVKSFTDDLAWQVQRALVENYFHAKQPAPTAPFIYNGDDYIEDESIWAGSVQYDDDSTQHDDASDEIYDMSQYSIPWNYKKWNGRDVLIPRDLAYQMGLTPNYVSRIIRIKAMKQYGHRITMLRGSEAARFWQENNLGRGVSRVQLIDPMVAAFIMALCPHGNVIYGVLGQPKQLPAPKKPKMLAAPKPEQTAMAIAPKPATPKPVESRPSEPKPDLPRRIRNIIGGLESALEMYEGTTHASFRKEYKDMVTNLGVHLIKVCAEGWGG